MKKSYLRLSLAIVAIFALCYFTFPAVKNFIADQLAAVIGIDTNEVIQWQIQGGLVRDLAFGDSGIDVALLQYALQNEGESLYVSHKFDPATSNALSDFQKKQGLDVTGTLDQQTRLAINAVYFKQLCPDGHDDTYTDEIMIHVNKDMPLPADYVPKNLVDISGDVKTKGIVCLVQDVVPHLQQMFTDANAQGVELAVSSGFRSPDVQSTIYSAWVALRGEGEKDRVAEPLHSEHQLGTAMDLTGASIGDASASDSFESTAEDLWLRANAYKYGFVLSYPKGKTSVTGYDYEPWHYRYVGVDVAKTIFDKNESVEEYFDSLK